MRSVRGMAVTSSNPLSIVRACLDAYVSKDHQAIERLIHEDYRFTRPLDNALSRTTYFDRCWPNSEQITGFDFISGTDEGKRAYIVYEGHTKDGKTFRELRGPHDKGRQPHHYGSVFGWDLPHPASPGDFIESESSGK